MLTDSKHRIKLHIALKLMKNREQHDKFYQRFIKYLG